MIVGIDLGTTHSALAYALPGEPVAILSIPQVVAPRSIEARPLLPSFVFFPHESDGKQPLPWDAGRTFVVGERARAEGASQPTRVVSSAKSWLSHRSVDRRAAMLPLSAPDDVDKVSAVEASWRFLEHLAEAYDAHFANGNDAQKLAAQEIVLTVPASFDAAARELTVEAAFAAGLENVTLLEEPQAAVYAWIAARGDRWRTELRPGDVLLVVDVGGGTTDFSAIAVVDDGGSLALSRVAVGDHILLGGDNMDLALAHLLLGRFEASGQTLDAWQFATLTHACRAAKERLLGDETLATHPVAVAGRGANLLGGTLRSELSRADVEQTLVQGFFPEVPKDARPVARARGALTQLGLPYASDPAVTRHLASFLGKQAGALPAPSGERRTFLHPTCILFNGGVMKSAVLRERLVRALTTWLAEEGAPPPRVLEGADYDLAVARGAAAYALARHGAGIRIRGGTARAYYVGIEDAAPAVPGVAPKVRALCIAPFGMEEGTSAELPMELGLVVGEKVQFRFFGSSVRRGDAAGVLLERWAEGELEELAPVDVGVPAEGREEGDVVPVRLHADVTAIGTLALTAIPLTPRAPDERFGVELNVREG